MPWQGKSYGGEGLDTLVLPKSFTQLELGFSVMVPVLNAMKNMGKQTAKLFLEKEYGWLEPHVITDLLEFNREYAEWIGAKREGTHNIPWAKNKFYATAWLCGASWGQIAKLFSVNSRTVAAAAKTFLQDNDREQLRINKGPISLERLSAIKQAYTDINNQEHLYIVEASVISIAKRVTSIVELEMNDLESAHDQAYFADTPAPSTPAHEESTQPILAEAQEEDISTAGAVGDAQLGAIKRMFSKHTEPPLTSSDAPGMTDLMVHPETIPDYEPLDDEPSEADKKRYGI